MDLDRKRKERATARGWLTREINKLEQLLRTNIENLAKSDISVRLEQVEKRMSCLDSKQTEVETLLTLDEMDADIDEASGYVDSYTNVKAEAERVLDRLALDEDDGAKSQSGSVRHTPSTVAGLPKIQLPRFSGDPLEFFSFWERFNVAVHETNIPEVNKFIYLNSILDGEALCAIKGLAVTPENYTIARQIITERFGRKEKVIFHHVEHLLTCKELRNSSNIKELWRFRDEIQCHIRALQALGIGGDDYGVFLTPIILSKLPVDIRLEWARHGEGRERDIAFLMDFLYSEINRKERSYMFQNKNVDESVRVREERKEYNKTKTVSAFVNHDQNECVVCGKVHKGRPDQCFKLIKSSKVERVNIIKSKNLCFSCLKKGHYSNNCTSKCNICKGNHHHLICNGNVKEETTGSENRAPSSSEVINGLNHTLLSNKVSKTILQLVKVNVRDECGNKTRANVLFDSGSDHTYVTSEVIQNVKPKCTGKITTAFAAFGSNKPSKTRSRNIFLLDIEGDNGFNCQLKATEIETISTPLYRPRLGPEIISFLSDFSITESFNYSKTVKIDILVGMDFMWKLLHGERVHVPDSNLVLHKTVFGWVVSGTYGEGSLLTTDHVFHQNLCFDPSVQHFQNMWDLDSIGVSEDLKTDVNYEDLLLLQNFENTVIYNSEGSFYKVRIPWENEFAFQNLLNNEAIARARLGSLMKRLNKTEQLKTDYFKVFDDMEAQGIIVEVPDEEVDNGHPIFYLPHHPVVKEQSLTTKVRPVFDASCPGSNGLSLNDCVHAGPCLLPNLIEVLLRFRRWPVALTADVKQAFLNIRVHSKDTNVHRFLLPKGDGCKIMKFERVPFGNKSSPFLLNATVKYHLAKYPETLTVSELKENLYVDDWITGGNTPGDCLQMIEEANDIMLSASLPLTKWASNDNTVNERLQTIGENKHCLLLKNNSFRILGVQWDKENDVFIFKGMILDTDMNCSGHTKRSVLSLIARLFDPLGLISPYIMLLKITFQEIWKGGFEWDEPLPTVFQERIDKWIEGLKDVREFQVQRRYSGEQWNLNNKMKLFAFSDASEKAYGACVYMAIELSTGSHSCNLVYAKARVAPLKVISLPRLELLGALLCARLIVFVRRALQLPDIPVSCYTDSTVALSWIKGNPSRWKTFVSNRVVEIQRLTSPKDWHHVAGKENPADLVSRGVQGRNLVSSELWLHGPSWTHAEISNECVDQPDSLSSECLVECELAHSNQLTVQSVAEVFEVARWSTFHKAVRIVGWVYRFIHNARHPSEKCQNSELELSELRTAEKKLIQCVQGVSFMKEIDTLRVNQAVHKSSSLFRLNPFIDEEGLLRVQGRLQFSGLSFDEICPIILPKGHLSIILIQHYHLNMKHAGVDTMITAIRSRFWIVGVRRMAKAVKSRCITCQIQDSLASSQATAPLPKERVQRAPPFSICGLDFAGPLFCADHPKRKFYVLLFTCAVVRAVHIELVDSLSVEDFLLGFIRFVCRRSLPSCIISDNAKTFIAAKGKLLAHYGPSCPRWKFNAPLSPWWGAFWERMVRSVKSLLRKTVGNRQIKRCELETTLHEVEACINSRPLTFVGADVNSVRPLTPSHFLTPTGRAGMFNPLSEETPKESTSATLKGEYSDRYRLIEQFWERWSAEYIRNLSNVKSGKASKGPTIGTLVMVRENDNLKRLQWPLGVVTQVFPGRDGLIRAVEINTSKGRVVRPIQRVHLLEAANESNELNSSDEQRASEEVSNDSNHQIGIAGRSEVITPKDKTMGLGKPYTTRRGRVVKPRKMLDL